MMYYTEIIKITAQIAGIGGICLGAFIILFREIIRKKIFPYLTKEQAHSLLRTMVLAIWSIAVLGIVSWVYIETHHSEIDKQRIGEFQSKLKNQEIALLQVSNMLNIAAISSPKLFDTNTKNEIDNLQKTINALENRLIILQNDTKQQSDKNLNEIKKEIANTQLMLDKINALPLPSDNSIVPVIPDTPVIPPNDKLIDPVIPDTLVNPPSDKLIDPVIPDTPVNPPSDKPIVSETHDKH